MKKYIFILLIIFNTFISSAIAQLSEHPLKYSPAHSHSISNLILYDDDGAITDCNFDNTLFRYINTSYQDICHTSFKNCIFQNGFFYTNTTNDYTNAYFAPNFQVQRLSPESFMQTRNYTKKVILFNLRESEFNNFDFSDFTISSYFRVGTEGAKFHNTWFKNAKIPKYLTQEQIKQTKNYQTGVFHGISFWEHEPYMLKFMREQNKWIPERQQIFQNLDISGMTFSFCELYGSFSGTNMTDTVFTESDLSTVEDLTLEQVKSTWNYKAGRMSLCKWPEYIEKALEEEEKAKAQEVKK